MIPDPGLEATRAVRERISREHGNDPRRLIDHYLKYQERFADRLQHAPGTAGASPDIRGDRAVAEASSPDE